MNEHPYFLAVVGSAAVGALVSSVVSALAQWRERKSRREELLLSKAMELANHRFEFAKLLAENSGKKVSIGDQVVMTEQYYQWLKYLMKHDTLPDDPKIQRARPSTDE